MGFLGFGNYSKPGPGISKDEMPKAAPVRYFEIYGRKFTKLVQANLVFFIPFVIAAALMVLLFFLQVPHVQLSMPSSNSNTGLVLDLWVMYVVPLPLIFVYPFVAGLTMVTRNFVREEHAFVWADFMKATKNNWKLFFANGVIIYLVYVVFSFSMSYYSGMLNQSWMYFIPFGMTVVAITLFSFAQYYLPIMFITFDLKFGQFYKNAFIFAIVGMVRNFLMTLLFVGLIIVAVFLIDFLILAIALCVLLPFLLFSFISYTTSFAVYPVIKKYMIDSQSEDKNKEEEVSKSEDKETSNNDKETKDDFVYVNGRLIKKSDLPDSE